MSATYQEHGRASSFASNKTADTSYTRSSVYQTNGKPLSEEAIYKAKLKYGVYNKPGAPMVGVANSASDSAALLATQTDLSVHPYKRDLSSEAATAALIAKTDSAPKAWKRENFAPDAEYAAISLRSIKYPFDAHTLHDDKESSDAASSVLKKDSSSIAREALEDLYAFDDIRNGSHTFTQFDGQSLKSALESSAASTYSKKAHPRLDYRSGIPTKSSQMKLNIAEILKQSSSNATKTMSMRSAPPPNISRSGLATKKLDYGSGAVDISKINSLANEGARKSLLNRMETSSRNHRTGIPTASDYTSRRLAATGAGLSLKTTSFPDYASYERDSLKNNSLVDKKVYAIAAANANKKLTQIENEAATKSMFSDRELNIKALQIAQANSLKRSKVSGKIDLGGGLMMDPVELQLLAASIVQPVLSDIDSKAIAQRQADFDRAKQHEDQKQKRLEYRLEQKRLKQEAIAKKEEEKQAKKAKLALDKELENSKQSDLRTDKAKELDDKKAEFDAQTKEENEAKEALLSEKLEAEQLIEEKETSTLKDRETALLVLQGERDEENAPVLEEFLKETTLLDELVSKRVAAEAFAKEQSERATKAEADLLELNLKIETTDTEIAQLREELSTLKDDSDKHTSEADLLLKEHESEIQTKALKEQEFIANNEKLEAEKADLQAKRAAALVSLQEAKQKAIDEELEINNALPEHLQKEVNQDLSDESDIDEDQFNTTDEEPEVPEVTKTSEPTKLGPTVLSSGSDSKEEASLPIEPKTDGNGLTYSEIMKSLKNGSSKVASKTASKVVSLKNILTTSPKKSWFKGKKESKSPVKPVAKPVAKPAAKPAAAKPAEVKKETKKEPEQEEKNELKQTFSGFSQGSIPDADKKKDSESIGETDSVLNDEAVKEQKEGLFKEDI